MPAPLSPCQREVLEAIEAPWHEHGIAPSTGGLAADVDATVKKLRRDGARLHPIPMNPKHEPLVVDPARVLIQGKVVSLRRGIEGNNHEPGGSR
jgi:hypothetical protein